MSLAPAAAAFAPHEALAAALLPHVDPGGDGAHDLAHLRRVWHVARAIQAAEGGDAEVICAAVLLHDCVAVPKDSPLRAQASRLAAERAADILRSLGWPPGRVACVAHAVEAHSFSAGIEPDTLEACILQDADRLDAIGLVGVARCFYTAGRMGSALYHADDPLAIARTLDDRAYALDHFAAKLLGLAATFRTPAGQRLAAERHERLERFQAEFLAEL
jgi:uncharacterized protein